MLEPEPLRLDHEIAHADGVGVDDRVLGQRVRLPLEHRQSVEPLERLFAPICAASGGQLLRLERRGPHLQRLHLPQLGRLACGTRRLLLLDLAKDGDHLAVPPLKSDARRARAYRAGDREPVRGGEEGRMTCGNVRHTTRHGTISTARLNTSFTWSGAHLPRGGRILAVPREHVDVV